MKYKFYRILILFLFIIGCSSNNNIDQPDIPTNTIKNKILCIGDSRVEGNRPNHESYRYELWKKLIDSGNEFDFIGPYKDNAFYGLYNNIPFDNDHAGIGGDNTLGVLNRYSQNVFNDTPDIVLLGIGGNDITGGATVDQVISNISSILDAIKTNNADAIVIVEIIAGANPTTSLGQTFNGLLAEFETKLIQLASSKNSGNFKVTTVNMNLNFTNDVNNYADAVHYSETGAIEIASRYFTVIEPFLE